MYVRVRRALGRRVRAVVHRLRSGAAERAVDFEPTPPLERDVEILFDADYYLDRYPDVLAAGVDPVQHYLAYGRAELRCPAVLFDPVWYREQNPDVADDGGDPLDHFLRFGGSEGRDPIPAGFDSRWYLERHPELAEEGGNPLVHFLTEGVTRGFDPSPSFDTAWYLEQYPDVAAAGINPLVHFLRFGADEGRRPNPRGTPLTGEAATVLPAKDVSERQPPSLAAVLAHRTARVRPLRTRDAESARRLNLVVDSLRPPGSFEPAATALAIEWANSTGRRLRVVTRSAAPSGASLEDLCSLLCVRPDLEPQLAFAPPGGELLPVGHDDVFVTTSWWSTLSVLGAIPAERVVYVVQEDERLTVPSGADTLSAAAALTAPGLQVVVSTEALRTHLVSTGCPGLESAAVVFEPSYAGFLRPGRRLGWAGRNELLFDARGDRDGDMFELGLAALDAAVEAGHLTGGSWRVHLIGENVPRFAFCDGSVPEVHRGLGWSGYQALVGRTDLALSLAASPTAGHRLPALAAGGAVVVTNSWLYGTGGGETSDRLIVAEPTVRDLVGAIGAAVRRVEECRREPFEPLASPQSSPWSQNLKPVIAHLARRFGDA